MAEIYPWQQHQWQSVIQRMENSRMPHALLLNGPEDTGKHDFAMMLANQMLCRSGKLLPCGHCKDCHLFRAASHPDIMHIQSKNHQQIKIGQIRELADFMGCYPHQAGYRVVIISPAEDMNLYAANALLKSLEEPAENTLMILISSRMEKLLPTITSRCQKIVFPVPPEKIAVEWLQEKLSDNEQALSLLQMSHGRPLAALHHAEDNTMEKWHMLKQGLEHVLSAKQSLVMITKTWQNIDAGFILEWMLAQLAAIIRYKMTKNIDYLPDFLRNKRILSCVDKSMTIKLINYQDWLIKVYDQLNSHININPQLLSESLLIRWRNVFYTN